MVSLIIDPSLNCPVSTRILYIVGSNISCLWRPSEIEIRNWIDDEFSEFTWFNEETCTNGQTLTAPCSKTDIESLVSILSIVWQFSFLVKWKRARTKKKLQCHIFMWSNDKKTAYMTQFFFHLNLHQGGILRFGVYQDLWFFISTYEHETSTVEIDSMAGVQNLK